MASEVIGLNCIFSSPNDISPKYSDHLLENSILDEPLYENGDIIKKIFQANNKLTKSLMRIHEENLNPSKDENIYENVMYRENKLNTINEIKNLKPILKNEKLNTNGEAKSDEEAKSSFNIQSNGANKDSLPLNKGLYTSTFSLTIGKPASSTIIEISEEKELNIKNNSQDAASSDSSDNETFKSSYAKSLLDSFRKHTPNTESAINNQNSLKQPSVIQQEIKTSSESSSENELNSVKMTPKVFKSIISSECPSKSIERLENRVSSLTDNILLKDKELEKLRQEVMFLKLECNRVKAENRSLKASLNNGINSRYYHSGNSDSHPHSPVSSISADSDTWTLQQQVASLNTQLEKAELSRHAYEAATKQLVHFLQTINSTLTTVGGSDAKLTSPFTSQNTSELLSNLESTLLENRSRTSMPPKIKTNPYFESSRDGSYLSKNDLHSPTQMERQFRVKNNGSPMSEDSKSKELNGTLGVDSDHYVSASSRSRSPHLNLISSISEDPESAIHIKEAVVHKIKSPSESKEEKKRSNPQRRFSISQKLFNSTKRPLVRSGSVNNLPTDLKPVPRVSRAVSTHCVAVDKIEVAPSESSEEASEQSNTNTNRMKNSKARDFFSSLKNLFKPEERTTQDAKKKSPLPPNQRSNKVKNDSAPLSLHLNVPSASTNLKKRHSMKTLSVARDTLLDEAVAPSTTNSTFYVPFFTNREKTENATSSASEESVDALPEADVEISGPRELSLSLPRETPEGAPTIEAQSKENSPSSSPGAPFNCSVSGGGFSTSTDKRDHPSHDSWLLSGEGLRYRRVDEIKSLELDNFNMSKKKLPRVESCREGISSVGLFRKNSGRSRGIRRRRSDFDAIGLKLSLWKLSRESYRAKECRVAFV